MSKLGGETRMDPMIGRIFMGRYEVQRLLGEGAMGRVYLAHQADLKRQVVVKIMHEEVATDAEFRERFEQETLVMARFQHPYAVTLHDATLDPPDGPCMVMEYVRGQTLDKILDQNKRLSHFRVSTLLSQLCEVLQAAHSQGIIHRDLKPTNLMIVDADTPYEKLKVMDFGLAKIMSGKPLRHMLDSGLEYLVGTPAYMCPEQVRGEEMDHRGDIYNVGVLLYELLTGRIPFSADATADMLLAHATESPLTMSEGDVWVPPAVERVVLSCLAKKPGGRPANARELSRKFEEALAEDEGTPGEEAPLEQIPMPDNSDDPSIVVFQLQAWMPESVASYKLKGYVQDINGEVVESVPGHLRVRLGGKRSPYKLSRSPLSWLGIGSENPIEMDLQMYQGKSSDQRPHNLMMTVVLRYLGRSIPAEWRVRCNQIYCDLRSYLIGHTESSASRV